MAFKMKWRQKPNATYIIAGIVGLALTLTIGNKLLASIGGSYTNTTVNTAGAIGNISGTPFADAFTFMGINSTSGVGWASGSIVGVMGLVAIGSFVLGFVKVSLH